MTFAQFIGNGNTGIIGIINTAIIPSIFALAFAFFLWKVVHYFFLKGDDEKKREEGRAFVLFGIIGMVVLFSAWAIVKMLLSTLGIAPGS